MSSTSAPTTFSDLYTDLLNKVRADSTTTTQIVLAKRMINTALQDVAIQQNWRWAERRAVLQVYAPYTTGTVSVALAARTTVTGISTLWNTAVTGMGFNNVNVGAKIQFAGTTDPYSVASIASDTSLTLTDRYIGDTALSGATYTAYQDEYPLASDFFRVLDTRSLSNVLDIPILGTAEFYRRFPRNARPGTPEICTIIELGPSGTVDSQPRIVFHPYPDDMDNIPYRYITKYLAVTAAGVGQTALIADTDEPIIPLRYRHVLILYAAKEWYRDRKDDQRSQEMSAEYVDLVKRMSGDTEPQRDRPRFIPQKNRYPIFIGRRGQGRFSTGSGFDEVRE